ncbi:HIRAN domain-containing protein [Streptosporangium sandarakinum]|uniref:HIRAN domain-containing protein n=1 Tax=Streptosporangium sandarakinum TaxID=1260955 RepID=UPI00367F9927
MESTYRVGDTTNVRTRAQWTDGVQEHRFITGGPMREDAPPPKVIGGLAIVNPVPRGFRRSVASSRIRHPQASGQPARAAAPHLPRGRHPHLQLLALLAEEVVDTDDEALLTAAVDHALGATLGATQLANYPLAPLTRFAALRTAPLLADAADGEEMLLRRERDNAADPQAIAIHRTCGTRIGYVAREVAHVIAPLLDLDDGPAAHATLQPLLSRTPSALEHRDAVTVRIEIRRAGIG